MSTIQLKTLPHDVRFPNTNQAQHCFTLYNEWVLCQKKAGDDEKCGQKRVYAKTLCPDAWIEKWDTEREEGNFAGVN